MTKLCRCPPAKGLQVGVLYRLLLFSLLLYPAILWSATPAEMTAASTEQFSNPHPGADLWRAVRQREQIMTGTSQVKGVQSGVLINVYGDRWREFRMYELLPVAGYVLGGMLLFITVFYFVRGRVPVEGGLTHQKLLRYSVYERMIHWFMAFIFLFLGFTGLVLLFGRSLLLPWMGPEVFSLLASASKEGHNLMGPLFLLALVLVFIKFVRRNIYQRGDLGWLLRGGGIIGKKHVPSNFFNMGEKTMFWLLVFVGGAIGVSGLILVFPVFGQGREIMELSHVAHTIGATIMLTIIIGHIYIGTIGMEGAIEGMKTGYCDLNWAREHHDYWAKQCEQRGEVLSEQQAAANKHPPHDAASLAQGAGK